MRIWHQSFTAVSDLPAYGDRLRRHIDKVVRPGTEVVLHGMLPGTYPGDYPGDDLGHAFLFAMHSGQWAVHALRAEREGFDAFAMCTLPDPMLREIRTIVDMPVVGAGETCFHLARMVGASFGLFLFNHRMAPRYLSQMREQGLADACTGIWPLAFTFHEVMEGAAGEPGRVIDSFKASARRMIEAGAEAIIPGEIPLNVLLASEGVHEVDGVAVIDSLGATLKMAEMMVELKAATGFSATRRGWYHAAPKPERVREVLDFYGLGRFL